MEKIDVQMNVTIPDSPFCSGGVYETYWKCDFYLKLTERCNITGDYLHKDDDGNYLKCDDCRKVWEETKKEVSDEKQ